MTYTLLTVDSKGMPHIQQGIQNIQVAKEARQLALTGRTIKQEKEHQEWMSKWFKEHPGQCYFTTSCESNCRAAYIFEGDALIK